MNTKLLFATMAAITCMAGAQAGSRAEKQAIQAGILDGSIVVPNAGGSCGVPTNFTASPYSDTGTTVGATNIINAIPLACNGLYTAVAGPDVVYSFTAGAAANLTFTVTPSNAAYDPSIYLVTSCADGSTCPAGFGADSTLGGQAESFSAALTNGTTYFLHIDSFYSLAGGNPGAQGPYGLAVTGTLPVQLQDFSIE